MERLWHCWRIIVSPMELLCQHIPYSPCATSHWTSFSLPSQVTTLTANKYGQGAEESILVEKTRQISKVGCPNISDYVCIIIAG